MPTLEERLEALERALSAMRLEQIDTRQLEERIGTLQQQIAEQRRRLSEHEQGLQQKFDSLTTVLLQQFSAVNARFNAMDTSRHQHFTSIDARFDSQTAALHAQFEDTNVAVTAVTVTTGQQGQDIRAIKEQITSVKEDIVDLVIKYDQLDRNITDLHSKVDQQGQEQGKLLQQILDRLPPSS